MLAPKEHKPRSAGLTFADELALAVIDGSPAHSWAGAN